MIKKAISIFLAICSILCLCSCGKKEAKININVIESEKSKQIVKSLNTMKIDEVLDDVRSIDLYLEPDFNNKKYTTKTSERSEDGAKQIDYYSGDTLVYTEFKVPEAVEFINYTKTKSKLDATVTYFTDSGDTKSILISTEKYRLYSLYDPQDPYGFANSNIVLYSPDSPSPFEGYAIYDYGNGNATFDSATYLENGNYLQYELYIDQDNIQTDYIKTLVTGKAPSTSKDILNTIQTDKSYDSAKILLSSHCKWYYDGNNWYIQTTLGLFTDSVTSAEKYIKDNNLKARIDAEDKAIIAIDDVVFPISEKAFISDGKLPTLITEELDASVFTEFTLDSNGTITTLDTFIS